MVHGTVRHFFKIVTGLILLGFVVVAVGAVRLSRGPVSLSELTPYLEDALNEQAPGFRVQLGDMALVWEHANQALDLRILDAKAVDDNGHVLAGVPEVGITVSPLALLGGEVRLRTVELIGPRLQLVRDAAGDLRFGMWYPAGQGGDVAPAPAPGDGGSEDVLKAIIGALAGGPQAPAVARDLQAVRVVRAAVTMTDERLHVDWRIPEATIELFRQKSGGIGVSASLRVDQGIDEAHLSLVGDYAPVPGVIDLKAVIKGLRPAALADIEEALAPLAALDLPLDGTATVSLLVTDTLEPAAFGVTVSGHAGNLRLPAPMSKDVPIKEISLVAASVGMAEAVSLDRLHIVLDNAAEGLPATVIGASGVVERKTEGDYGGALDLSIDNISVAGVQAWWPPGVGDGARDWVISNLSNGRVTHGEWQVPLAGPTLAEVTATGIAGRVHADGVTVDFLRPMKPVQEASADLIFANDRIDFDLHSGKVFGLKVTGGTISFTGLDIGQEAAVINLDVEGPVDDALVLLDQKPLGYPARLGLKPSQADGQAKVKLRLSFPLLSDLKLEQLDVQATAMLNGVVLRQAVFGRDLTDGDVRLDVTVNKLTASGQAFVDGIPANFVWEEMFNGKPFASRYSVQAVVQEDKRSVFGLTSPPFIAPYAVGPANVDMEVTVYRGGETAIGVQADLTDTKLAFPIIGWTKPAGVGAQANVSVRMENGDVADVPRFQVRTANNEVIEGNAAFGEGGHFGGVTLDKVQVDGTNAKGAVRVRGNGMWEVRLDGELIDARTIVGLERKAPVDGAPAADTAPEQDEKMPPMDLVASFATARTSEAGSVNTVKVRALRDADRWTTMHVDGMAGSAPVMLDLLPGDTARMRDLRIEAGDAGAFLDAMGLLSTMRGGRLVLRSTVDTDESMSGVLSVDDYRLVDAPLLARVLSVAALTGILDALSGEGIGFSNLEAPFTLKDDILTLTDFRTYGSALGLTAEGTIDLKNDRYALTGTMVPAYAVNSLLGKIPLVGGLLTGFEQDGGMFAANYTVRGPLAEPDISVNPLSALAPGFLRRVFNILDTPPEPAPAPSTADTPVYPPTSDQLPSPVDQN